jgi:hypothetical protein
MLIIRNEAARRVSFTSPEKGYPTVYLKSSSLIHKESQ